jgi:predicted glycoside hydrolase/deacetylase ChbG (UPF0249 family)
MKHVILCADDYGQNDTISQGILELVANHRLSAVSCMTNFPDWNQHGHALKPFADAIDIGLHFNLTEGKPLSSFPHVSGAGQFPSIVNLIVRSHTGLLNKEAIRTEFQQQLTQFRDVFGRYPDFIDGHMHCHHFPIIRDVILQCYDDAFKQHGTYFRNVAESSVLAILLKPSKIKRIIISCSGAHHFKRELAHAQLPHNTSFSGVYDFSRSRDYRFFYKQFLSEIEDGGLIMCHPGLDSHDTSDKLFHSRFDEYLYLNSAEFLLDCARTQVQLSKFQR